MESTGKYKVVLIEEGLGNLGTCFYYPRACLEQAVANKIFDGKKAYANHPSKFEEAVQPERSVKDIVGHYENVAIEDGDEGQALMVADFITIPGQDYDWCRSMVESALNYAGRFDAQLIGLSINAAGNSKKIPIETLIEDATLPLSVKPKLLKAKAEGAAEVEYCSDFQEAVSVDLVTEAGARGRFLKMIESERARMSKKKEADDKKPDASQKPAGADASHADADQDKQLIAEMLKKYVGDGEHSEEVHEAMKCAYQNAKEMGLEGDEAEKAAGYSMKMAKHAHEKKEKHEAEKKAAEAAAKKDEDGGSMAMEAEVTKLRGQVAGLEKKLADKDLSEFIDKTIKESGLSGSVATKLRESIASSKSETEAKEKSKIFVEALKLASDTKYFTNPEKTVATEGGFSLADCVRKG